MHTQQGQLQKSDTLVCQIRRIPRGTMGAILRTATGRHSYVYDVTLSQRTCPTTWRW